MRSEERQRPPLGYFQRKVRQWLGVAELHQQLRRIEDWNRTMAVSQEDLERLNAATSRIAARVAALLDKIDQLGTGNDDAVRAEQKAADLVEASNELRPLIEQLEGLGADATQPVPEPDPNQVPVEPGPDVPPVENTGGDDGAPVEDLPPADDGSGAGDGGGDTGAPTDGGGIPSGDGSTEEPTA